MLDLSGRLKIHREMVPVKVHVLVGEPSADDVTLAPAVAADKRR